MKKWKVTWYDQNSIIKEEDEPIEADTYDEALSKAYTKYNGNPPAPLLSLIEIQ